MNCINDVWKKNKDLFLFTRHYLSSSEIYYNYINETQYEKSIARSYPDFFVKYKEKIFVIEIKSENDDIKPEKTVSLFRAYKNISKIMNNQNYIFLIIKVDTSIKPYEFNVYKWCNGEIEEHLNQYTLENAFN